MRKYDTQYQCLDEHCKTIVVGNGKYMDGIRCPRCDGPVVPQPFRKHKKVSDDTQYVLKEIFWQNHKHCFDLTAEQVDTVLEIFKENKKLALCDHYYNGGLTADTTYGRILIQKCKKCGKEREIECDNVEEL